MGINASRDTLREEARESLQSDVYVDGGTQPRHLIVFANGLFGSPANWDFMVDSVMRSMKDKQPFAHCVLHKSQENALLRTFDGIDVCGERLAREIRFEVERNPTLKKISLIGHSMGGLIARYAAGKLYDPQTGLIAGLKPMHYVSMATPHLGVAGEEGENSVPFIDWSEVLPKGPQIGKLRPWDLTRFLRDNAAPVTTLALGRTGAQLFLEDGDAADRARQNEPGALAAAMQYRAKLGGWSTGLPPELEMSRAAANACAGDDGAAQGNGRSAREVAGAGPEPPGATNGSRGAGAPKPPPGMERLGAEPDGSTVTLADMPLVYRMAFDVPERREYFISALKAFKSRTCYANVDLDHLVSWPNSSLRASNALPAYDPERLREARGVVHADPLPCAWDGELSRREARAAAEAARRAAPNSAEAVRIAMRGSRYPEVPEGGGFQLRPDAEETEEGRSGSVLERTDTVEDPSDGMELVPPRGCSVSIMRRRALHRLQQLPWRRIDVAFGGTTIPVLAHMHIQVTRKVMNSEGAAVPAHVAQQLALMEETLRAAEDEAVVTQDNDAAQAPENAQAPAGERSRP